MAMSDDETRALLSTHSIYKLLTSHPSPLVPYRQRNLVLSESRLTRPISDMLTL
jgi:hypothetical protein